MRKIIVFNMVMFKMTPIKFGISIGTLLSILAGLAYVFVLHEPGPAFYWFAVLVFLGGPLVGGVVAVLKMQERKIKTFFCSSGIIFGIVFALFIVMYVVLPQYSRTSVQLPESCSGFDGSFNPPQNLTYNLPDTGIGILLTENTQSAVVATIDGDHAPFSCTMYLMRKSDSVILKRAHFNNDVITASIHEGTVYIYNDKLGYLVDERTGEFEETILLIDNYGGLSETDRPFISRASSGNWYLETTGVVSSWNIDGTVKSRPYLTFNGIARGCFVSGSTGEVVHL